MLDSVCAFFSWDHTTAAHDAYGHGNEAEEAPREKGRTKQGTKESLVSVKTQQHSNDATLSTHGRGVNELGTQLQPF